MNAAVVQDRLMGVVGNARVARLLTSLVVALHSALNKATEHVLVSDLFVSTAAIYGNQLRQVQERIEDEALDAETRDIARALLAEMLDVTAVMRRPLTEAEKPAWNPMSEMIARLMRGEG